MVNIFIVLYSTYKWLSGYDRAKTKKLAVFADFQPWSHTLVKVKLYYVH